MQATDAVQFLAAVRLLLPVCPAGLETQCVGAVSSNEDLRGRLTARVAALLASEPYAADGSKNPLQIVGANEHDMWRALSWLTHVAHYDANCVMDERFSAGLRERYSRGDAALPRIFVAKHTRPYQCMMYDPLVKHWAGAHQANHQFMLDWPFFGPRSTYVLPWPLWPSSLDGVALSREAIVRFYDYTREIATRNPNDGQIRLVADYLRAAAAIPPPPPPLQDSPERLLDADGARHYVIDAVWGSRGRRSRTTSIAAHGRGSNGEDESGDDGGGDDGGGGSSAALLLQRWNERRQRDTVWTRLHAVYTRLQAAQDATAAAERRLDDAARAHDALAEPQARRDLEVAQRHEDRAAADYTRRSREEVPFALDTLVRCGANPVRDELYALQWQFEHGSGQHEDADADEEDADQSGQGHRGQWGQRGHWRRPSQEEDGEGARPQPRGAGATTSVNPPQQWFSWGTGGCRNSCYVDAWLVAAITAHTALRGAVSTSYGESANLAGATLMLEQVRILLEQARSPHTRATDADDRTRNDTTLAWLSQRYGSTVAANWWNQYTAIRPQPQTLWQWLHDAVVQLPENNLVDEEYRRFLLHEAKMRAWVWFQQKSGGQLDPSSGNLGGIQFLHDDFDANMAPSAVFAHAWGIATSSPHLGEAARERGPMPLPRVPYYLPYPTRFPHRATMIVATVTIDQVLAPVPRGGGMRRLEAVPTDRIETNHVAILRVELHNDGPTTYTGSVRVRLIQDVAEEEAILQVHRDQEALVGRTFDVALEAPFPPGERRIVRLAERLSLVVLPDTGIPVAAVQDKVAVHVTGTPQTEGFTAWTYASQFSLQRDRLMARVAQRRRDPLLVQQPVNPAYLMPFSRTLNEYVEQVPRVQFTTRSRNGAGKATPAQVLVLYNDQVQVQTQFRERIVLEQGEYQLMAAVLYDARRAHFTTLYRAAGAGAGGGGVDWSTWYAFDSMQRDGRAFPISRAHFRKMLYCNTHRVSQAWYWRVSDPDQTTLARQDAEALALQDQFSGDVDAVTAGGDDESLAPFVPPAISVTATTTTTTTTSIERREPTTVRTGGGRGGGTGGGRGGMGGSGTAGTHRRSEETFSSTFVPFLWDVFNKRDDYESPAYSVDTVRQRVGADAWDTMVREAREHYRRVGTTWEQLRPNAQGYVHKYYQEWALGQPLTEAERHGLQERNYPDPYADLDPNQNVPIAFTVGAPLEQAVGGQRVLPP